VKALSNESDEANEWIDTNISDPTGDKLVALEPNKEGKVEIHVANFHKNITTVGGRFDFDMPKITHWKELPEIPKYVEPEVKRLDT